jgi:HPt (histidine-containing phosphotransfer) domain-containing protein
VPILNLYNLKEFDNDLISQILTIYLTDVTKDINQLSDLLDGNSHEEIRRLAHKIVGASKTVGAIKVSTIAEEIEDKAEKKIPQNGAAVKESLSNAFNEVKEHIYKNDLLL